MVQIALSNFSKLISFHLPWLFHLYLYASAYMLSLHFAPITPPSCTAGKFQFFLREQCSCGGFPESQDIQSLQIAVEMAATEMSWWYIAKQGDKYQNRINTVNCFYAYLLTRPLTSSKISHHCFLMAQKRTSETVHIQ